MLPVVERFGISTIYLNYSAFRCNILLLAIDPFFHHSDWGEPLSSCLTKSKAHILTCHLFSAGVTANLSIS
jgi:hypothetical protein